GNHCWEPSVSTHAPAWGATPRDRPDDPAASFNPRARVGRDTQGGGGCASVSGFQPTRPRGARHWHTEIIASESVFQPTRPRGARLTLPTASAILSSFNPRARVGRDGAP